MAKLDGAVEYLNAAGRALVGIDRHEDVTRYAVANFLTDEGLRQSEEVERPAISECGSWQGESTLRHFKTGEAIPVTINSYLVMHPDTGQPLAVATVQRDIRQHKAIEEALSESNRELGRHVRANGVISDLAEFALSASLESVYQRTVSSLVQELHAFAAGIFTPHENGLLDLTAVSVLHDDIPVDRWISPELATSALGRSEPGSIIGGDDYIVAIPIPGRSGAVGILEVAMPKHLKDDQQGYLAAIVGLLSAAAGRRRTEEALQFAALHDPLTSLPNRALMLDRLEKALERRSQDGRYVVVCLIDIDHFKLVNDSLGHATGDKLLLEFSHRLAASTRTGDTVSRLGGDEFVVICENVADEVEAVALAKRLEEAWLQPYDIDSHNIFIVASTGVALANASHVSTPTEMLLEADTAMYRAKHRRLGGIEMYNAAMKATVSRRLSLSTALHVGLESGEVFVEYQPIVSLATGRCEAVEALARWSHDGMAVPPSEFIPLAEGGNLIIPFGLHVLRTACSTVLGWSKSQPHRDPIALRVNVSGRQVISPTFVRDVTTVAKEAGFPLELLGLEVTEAVLIEEQEMAQQRFERLRSLGVSLLLDDFGTGYSSLLYLRRFTSLRFLKIDQSFVAGIVETPTDATIVGSIANLGHAFGLEVVAEGIETPEQAEKALELGCDYAQGFYFSRPLPANSAYEYLYGTASGFWS